MTPAVQARVWLSLEVPIRDRVMQGFEIANGNVDPRIPISPTSF